MDRPGRLGWVSQAGQTTGSARPAGPAGPARHHPLLREGVLPHPLKMYNVHPMVDCTFCCQIMCTSDKQHFGNLHPQQAKSSISERIGGGIDSQHDIRAPRVPSISASPPEDLPVAITEAWDQAAAHGMRGRSKVTILCARSNTHKSAPFYQQLTFQRI